MDIEFENKEDIGHTIKFPANPSQGQREFDGQYMWEYKNKKWSIIGDGENKVFFGKSPKLARINWNISHDITEIDAIIFITAILIVLTVIFNVVMVKIAHNDGEVNLSSLNKIAFISSHYNLDGVSSIECATREITNSSIEGIDLINDEKVNKCISAFDNWNTTKYQVNAVDYGVNLSLKNIYSSVPFDVLLQKTSLCYNDNIWNDLNMTKDMSFDEYLSKVNTTSYKECVLRQF